MDVSKAKSGLEKAKKHFKLEISKIRGSRANPGLLEDIKVDVYGSQMPIKQIGNVNVVDPTLLTVVCWDKQNAEPIRKAIEDSELNVTPSIDGTTIRVPLPPLTQERREELVKIVNKMAEDVKISARHTRREFLDLVEEANLSEDEVKRLEKQVQELIDEFNEYVESELEKKEEELMKI